MQFGVAFQIMQSTEARLAGLANERLLLAMGEKMAFQVVLASELGGAVRAAMFLR